MEELLTNIELWKAVLNSGSTIVITIFMIIVWNYFSEKKLGIFLNDVGNSLREITISLMRINEKMQEHKEDHKEIKQKLDLIAMKKQ